MPIYWHQQLSLVIAGVFAAAMIVALLVQRKLPTRPSYFAPPAGSVVWHRWIWDADDVRKLVDLLSRHVVVRPPQLEQPLSAAHTRPELWRCVCTCVQSAIHLACAEHHLRGLHLDYVLVESTLVLQDYEWQQFTRHADCWYEWIVYLVPHRVTARVANKEQTVTVQAGTALCRPSHRSWKFKHEAEPTDLDISGCATPWYRLRIGLKPYPFLRSRAEMAHQQHFTESRWDHEVQRRGMRWHHRVCQRPWFLGSSMKTATLPNSTTDNADAMPPEHN